MHRITIDVHHWMTEKQFADAYAIAQLSPGPNVLIVTLIGYAVAGIPGALAATLAILLCRRRCLPIMSADLLSRLSLWRRWPGLDPGCTGSAVDRTDGGQCPHPGPVDRSHLLLRCF